MVGLLPRGIESRRMTSVPGAVANGFALSISVGR
jgi:hypothetical protein